MSLTYERVVAKILKRNVCMWAYFTDYCSLGCSLSFRRESSGYVSLLASKLPDDSSWPNSTVDSQYFYLVFKKHSEQVTIPRKWFIHTSMIAG